MPNLARNRSIVASACLALCSACGSAISSQSVADAAPTVAQNQPFYDFIAEGSSGHHLDLKTEPGNFDRVSAVLNRSGQVWRASDQECVALREMVERFKTLPSLRPGPLFLQPGAGPGNPMPNRWNGETWRVRTRLFGPDWSSMNADMHVVQGPYVIWLSDVVAAIKSCNPPV